MAYPNPASAALNIVFSATEPTGATLLLRNALGQMLSLQVAGETEELWVRVVH